MPTSLTNLKENFFKNGYSVLEGLFTPEEAEMMRLEGQNLIKEMPEQSHRAVFSTIEGKQNRDQFFLDSAERISYFYEEAALDQEGRLVVEAEHAVNKVGHALHRLNPLFRKFTFDERIKEACFQLGLAEPAVVQSMFIYKNPKIGGEVTPHQDGTFLQTEPSDGGRLVGFWVALEDAALDNGCLRVARGSHTGPLHRRYSRTTTTNNNNSSNKNELLAFDRPASCYQMSSFTAVPVAKGDCILLHGHVVHYSDTNRSARSRNAYTFHIIEQKNTTYSQGNWLQPTEPFMNVYKTVA